MKYETLVDTIIQDIKDDPSKWNDTKSDCLFRNNIFLLATGILIHSARENKDRRFFAFNRETKAKVKSLFEWYKNHSDEKALQDSLNFLNKK
jgi:hypothetical protein